jgi:hypothetical protein
LVFYNIFVKYASPKPPAILNDRNFRGLALDSPEDIAVWISKMDKNRIQEGLQFGISYLTKGSGAF